MKLISFDFDGTFFFTPEPVEGKKVWKQKTGFEYPHSGWWSKPETLDTDIFEIPMNKWVYNRYLEHMADDDCYVILATGRLIKMEKLVKKILTMNNLSFEGVYCNNGGDTFNFKTRLFESLARKINATEITMYDDRHEHLLEFKKWGRTQNFDVNVIDVNKKSKI